MTLTAAPTVTVAGAAVAGALAGAPSLVAVDALRIAWGRGSVLEAPQPATATLTVLDRAAGAPFARRTDLIGQVVTLGWSAPGGYGGPMFTGRITDVAVTPRPGGGFRVALAASSLEVDLANYVQPEGAVWPAETLTDRRSRILSLIPSALLHDFGGGQSGLVMPDVFALGLLYLAGPGDLGSLQVAALNVGGKSVLDLLRQLYASWSPLPAAYDPAGRFVYAGRRHYTYASAPGLTMSAGLVASPDRAGRYVVASLAGLHLDGGLTGYSGSLGQQLDSRITEVEVQWSDGTNAHTATAPTYATGSESALGRRTLSIDSMLGTASGALMLASLYADLASVEARVPRLGAVGWSSAREPLPDVAHANLLLSAYEQPGAVFVSGSWLPRLGVSPLLGIIGGTIGYAAGDWTVDATPAPTLIDPRPGQWAPLTVGAVKAQAPTVRLRDVDRSVTFGDLRYVDMAPGRTSVTAQPYKGNPLP